MDEHVFEAGADRLGTHTGFSGELTQRALQRLCIRAGHVQHQAKRGGLIDAGLPLQLVA